MKTRTVVSPLLLIMLAGGLVPCAQALELKDAVEQTIIHNPAVRLKLHQYLGAQAEQGIARAGFLPTVDLSHTSARELTPVDKQAPGRIRAADSTLERWGWSVNLSQNLFNGFQTLNQVRQQNHAQRAQYYQFLDATEQQGLAAAQAYLDVLRLRQLLAVTRANFSSHQSIYQKIEKKVGAGVAPRVDLEQAAGRLALAEANQLTAQSNLDDAAAQYLRIVGTAVAADMQPLSAFAWMPPQDAAAQQRLIQGSPANLAASAGVQSAQLAVNVRRGAFMPTLEARARHDWGSGVPGARSGAYDRKSFELVSQLNLSRGGADRARLEVASQKLNSSLAQRDRVCRETLAQLSVAANDVAKLKSKLGFLQQHALTSEKVRNAYLDQFETGKRSLLDVLDSENEWFSAESALINGTTELTVAQMKGAAASGQLLPALQLKTLEPAPFEGDSEPLAADCA
jgi:adhesin transport system outer membrane protein